MRRHLIPAVAISIGHQIAKNDLSDDLDTIAVNCWKRYHERSTGRLQDAFVAELSASKKSLVELNLDRADPVEAFRALKGTFAYSDHDVIPIEPQIGWTRMTSDLWLDGTCWTAWLKAKIWLKWIGKISST